MKHLCFDYGSRRIGIAISDPTGTLVRPLTTIDCKITPRYIDEIKGVIDTENPDKLIFGLPLDPQGYETEMCAKIRAFVDKLYEIAALTLPFDFQDESFSSVTTQSIMIQTSSKKRRRDKNSIDRIAACVILESYLRESSGQVSLY